MSPDSPQARDDDAQGDRQPKIVVDDPEDFAKTRQLRAIFDARDEYIDARRDANRQMEKRKIKFPDRNRRVFRHLQDLAMTMEPLLKSYDAGREIWEKNTYGVESRFCAKKNLLSFERAKQRVEKAVSEPPSEKVGAKMQRLLDDYEEAKYGGMAMGSLGEKQADIRKAATDWGWHVQGLGSLIERTHTLRYSTKQKGKSFESTPPPQEICDAAFRDLQDFIRQIGLGVQFDTEQQTKIDDGLLEEVDEWRRQNV